MNKELSTYRLHFKVIPFKLFQEVVPSSSVDNVARHGCVDVFVALSKLHRGSGM